jgi:hypothetical protein
MRDHGGAGPLSEIADARKVVGMRVGVGDMRQSRIAGGQRLLELVHLIQAWIDGQGGTAGLVHHEVRQAAVAPGPEGLEGEGGAGAGERRHVASSMAFHS